ncbi:hypothetical protein DID75_03655 [Candidatus Marinamargulisbacteria bacterium SCGC AG-410-N11]|nr:hypothetical protein DID75_03655 [Candidatus Marinamargulisbacteria bacterium SCGC AG-410-N11]
MLSRVAESIFWFSRYLERTENTVRFLAVQFNLEIELSSQMSDQWAPLIKTICSEELFYKHYSSPTKENIIQFLTFDENNPNSILATLNAARENARIVRERIPQDCWQYINKLYLDVQQFSTNQSKDYLAFFDMIKQSYYQISGVLYNTLPYSEEFHFFNLGKQLERANQITRLLDTKFYYLLDKDSFVGNHIDLIQWTAVLHSLSAVEVYRRTFGTPEPANIASFLLLDSQFPRSLRYCIIDAQASLHKITGNDLRSFVKQVEKTMGRLRANLDYIEIDEIFSFGLHNYIDRIQQRINTICNNVKSTFFEQDLQAKPELSVSKVALTT